MDKKIDIDRSKSPVDFVYKGDRNMDEVVIEMTKRTSSLPEGYSEALNRISKIVPSIGLDDDSPAGVAMKRISKTSEDITKQIDNQGISDALEIFSEAAKKATEGIEKIPMSEGMREFNRLTTFSKPKTVFDYSQCLKLKEELDNMVSAYYKEQPMDFFVYGKLSLDPNRMKIIIQKQAEITKYCEDYAKQSSPYDIERVKQNLDYLLEQNNITRNDLERILGVGQSYFNRAFNPTDEKRRMSAEIQWRICKLFNISEDRFLTEDLRRTRMRGESKTFTFMATIIEASENRKLKWEQYRPCNDTSEEADKAIKQYCGIDDENDLPFTKNFDPWMAKGSVGTLYFVETTNLDDDSKEDFAFGSDKGSEFTWIIVTDNKNQQNIKPLCRQLYEIIKSFDEAGYVTEDVEDLIDTIMDGLK